MTGPILKEPETRLYSRYIEIATRGLFTGVGSSRDLDLAERTIGAIRLDEEVPPPVGIEIPMHGPWSGFDVSLGFATGFGNKHAIKTAAQAASPTLAQSFSHVASIETSDPELWQQLDNFWFEFDLRNQQSAAASVYFSPSAQELGAQAATSLTNDQPQQLTQTQIQSACAGMKKLVPNIDGEDLATLESTLRTYQSVRPFLLCGAMLGRRPIEARVVFAFSNIQEASACLNKLGITCHEGVLHSLNESYGDLTERVLLGIAPLVPGRHKIGLELYAPNGWMRSDGRDRQLIDRMMENGHCDPAPAQTIQNFPGLSVVDGGREHWPIVPHRDGFAQADVRCPICVRRFHHVKFSIENGEIKQTKTYLSSHFQWSRM